MAKVTSPLHSSEAHGQFGKSLIYQSGSLITTVRQYFKKKDPETPEQIAQRLLFKEGLSRWKGFLKTVHRAWWLETREVCQTARDGFMREWLNAKGIEWEIYPWVPLKQEEVTIRICRRYATHLNGWATIKFKTYLVSKYPYYVPGAAKSYTELQLNQIATGQSMEAGFDLYEADEPDVNHPSFQYVKSYEGGKKLYKIDGYEKKFAAVMAIDRYGKLLRYSKDRYGRLEEIIWLYKWSGWEW